MEPVFTHLRVVEKIGEGGMGVVYRAEDSRLGRQVAVKVLPAKSSDRDDLRVRLLREARVAASLNHPNICTIHEVGQLESDGTPFLVMELLRGETLHALLERTSPLPVKDLLDIAVQVAEGLAEAHAHQIVHRDLKPSNVMVGEGGRVKILDFGLAKPVRDVEPTDDVMTRAATHSSEISKLGHVIGTAAYMSPEQALGQTLDSRSDVFAFGTMLYEMATGRRPFVGQTHTSTIAKILESEPTVPSVVRPELPADLERIIRRCLQKKPPDRYNDTRDLVGDLRDLRQALTSGLLPKAVAQPSPWVFRGWVTALVAFVAVSAAFLLRPAPEKLETVQPSFKQITFLGDAKFPTVSPDGQFIAFVTGSPPNLRVLVQDLVSSRTLEVFRPTRSPSCPRCSLYVNDLKWSPDGANILVTADGGVFIVSRLGGTSRLIGSGSRAAWSHDGSQVAAMFTSPPGLRIIDVVSGKERVLGVNGPITWMTGIDWSLAGQWILFVSDDGGGRTTLWIIKPDGSGQRRLFDEEVAMSARWAPAGDAIYILKGKPTQELLKLRVDRDGTPQGTPVRLLTGLEAGSDFSVSRDGRHVAFQRINSHSNLRLISVGAGGKLDAAARELTTGTLLNADPKFSPDGTRIAFARGDSSASNIFVLSLDGGSPQQLTFLNSVNRNPVWSPDGSSIAFGSKEGGTAKVWQVPAATGPPRALPSTNLSADTLSVTWAPSRNILYHRSGNRNFYVVDPRTLTESPLLNSESTGWSFKPELSRGEKQIVVVRNIMFRGQGLYLFPFDGAAATEDAARQLTGAMAIGNVAQDLDAAAYRGKEIKLSVQGRANVNGNANRGQCYLRVDRPNQQRGFFYNMEDRPIRSASWKKYEIAGRVDADAARVVWGCFLRGVGEFWADEFALSFKSDDGKWMPIQITNAGFESNERGQSPTGWGRPNPAYTARVVDDRPSAGRRSLRISAVPLPEGNFTAIGWSADDTQVYAVLDYGQLVALPVAGGEFRALGTIPIPAGQSLGDATISPDGRWLVFSVVESLSDIWVVDDFDPASR